LSPRIRRLLFVCFLLSGFAGLVDQIVWVRAALASFGVITPFASVVVSVFMLGLALGTWLGGRYTHAVADRLGRSPLEFYGWVEAAIGLSAFVLPALFAASRALLLPLGGMQEGGYLLLSSLLITLIILPFCVCMGLTFPTMMAFIEREDAEHSGSFSFLYLANVIGAFVGAVATPLLLIELLGFRSSLYVAAAMNFAAAGACIVTARRRGPQVTPEGGAPTPVAPPVFPEDIGPGLTDVVLFMTGFTAMALEIVWMRAFTPILGTLVYAFSGLLAVYLLATFIGSATYRRHRARGRVWSVGPLVLAAPITLMLPIFVALPDVLTASARALLAGLQTFSSDVPVWLATVPLALVSIAPFCALLGYLTPMLVDHRARGVPERAGRAYAINIAGSILGPLMAAYLFLPTVGARVSMWALALPFLVLFGFYGLRPATTTRRALAIIVAVLTLVGFVRTGVRGQSFEEGSHIQAAVVRRDHTATVISYGQGKGRHLLVNGYGMTVLTTLTKVMAHFPLGLLEHEPKRALVIAFGMGTTFRSLLSWDIEATAVELVPSVVDAFPYYHDDAAEIVANPRGHIVVDDGRRFLARTDERFDVITIDPPPPVETAGSSLLYALEFHALAKRRLAEGGLVHHWFPDGIRVEPAIRRAVLRSAVASFDHVRVFQSHHGFGLHIVCSMAPIDIPEPDAFIARMPAAAVEDLMEWAPRGADPAAFMNEQILSRELPLGELLEDLAGPVITDDRPYNEYFALRRALASRDDSDATDEVSSPQH